MEITTEVNRSWFSKYWNKEIRAEFKYSGAELSELVHRVLTEVVPTRLYSDAKIRDLKGRDKLNLQLNTFTQEELPTGDEFLYIKASTPGDTESETLEFRANSPFDSFEGSHHILHNISQSWSTDLTHRPDPKLLGFIAPMKVECFRLGIEKFQSKLSPLSFGYTPTVVEGLLIDCKNGVGSLKAYSEILKSEGDLPLEDGGECRKVLDVLRVITNK